jgi:hypothetical protein
MLAALMLAIKAVRGDKSPDQRKNTKGNKEAKPSSGDKSPRATDGSAKNEKTNKNNKPAAIAVAPEISGSKAAALVGAAGHAGHCQNSAIR